MIDEVKKRLKKFKIDNLPRGHQPIWERHEKEFVLKVVFAGSFGIGNFCLPGFEQTCERDAYSAIDSLDPCNTVYFRNMKQGIVGCVYEKTIIRELVNAKVCDRDAKVSVAFDHNQSEKVYVTFESQGGKIPQEVYNAVKFRRLTNGIRFFVMSEEETLKHALANKMGVETKTKFQEHRVFMPYPEFCPLPTCCETQMKGYITHVVNCQKFSFKPFLSNGPHFDVASKRCLEAIRQIQNLISNAEIKAIRNSRNLKRGELLLVECEDVTKGGVDNFQRATFVECIDDINVKVREPIQELLCEKSMKLRFKNLENFLNFF